MKIKEIMKLLPHRYPFLLVDRVEEIVPNESIKAFKNLTMNEEFFQGHFPGEPIMPGVLSIEAMAQAAGILAMVSLEKDAESGTGVYFMSIEKAKFRKPIVPGDVMNMEVTVTKKRGLVWKFAGKAVVNGKVASEAEFTAMLSDEGVA